jgi:hypothetical protein
MMERPQLCPGDEFAARNPQAFGNLINFIQKAKSVDDESLYTHTGIITDPYGTTLESSWRVTSQNLWEAQRGRRVLIVRNINMTLPVYTAGFNKIRKHIGQWYPVPRLLLHLVGLAKWIHWDMVVCSELTAKFETGCSEYLGPDKTSGFMRNHYGVNPDNLVDRWKISRYYTTVFEGVVA